MKKIILCAVVAIATLTFVSCGEQETVKNKVVGEIYTEQVEGGLQLVKKYGEKYYPVVENVFSKITYDKTLNLVFAYTGKTFSVFTNDGNVRGDGGYEAYKVDGDVVYFTKDDKTMIYTKKGVVIGTFTKGNFAIDHNKIFTKNPKGLWLLRNLDGEFITDLSYEKIYIIDMKEDGSYDILCCRDGAWSLMGSDGGTYDKSSTDGAVKALKRKNPTAPVGVMDI